MMICEKTGKVSFWTEKAAKKAANNLKTHGRAGSQKERLRPYLCGGHYHIGHDYNPPISGQRRG